MEERYFLQKVKLGKGSCGVVWRGVDRQTEAVVAIKQLERRKLQRNGVSPQDVEREMAVMKACAHDNITSLYNCFQDSSSIYLVLEFCEGGDFGDKVRERGLGLKEDEARTWIQQVLAALHALHSKSVCHRDIKPDNFMVSSGGILKLVDFGLALFLNSSELLKEKCGTPAFMAPEIHLLPKRSKGYSFPVDIWAAGLLMYMVMSGGQHPWIIDGKKLDEQQLLRGDLGFNSGGVAGAKTPPSSMSALFGQLLSEISDGGQSISPSVDGRFSSSAKQCCCRMVNPNPAQRITATAALQDPWFTEQTWNSKIHKGGASQNKVPLDSRNQSYLQQSWQPSSRQRASTWNGEVSIQQAQPELRPQVPRGSSDPHLTAGRHPFPPAFPSQGNQDYYVVAAANRARSADFDFHDQQAYKYEPWKNPYQVPSMPPQGYADALGYNEQRKASSRSSDPYVSRNALLEDKQRNDGAGVFGFCLKPAYV